jgi:hypothetical protein
MSKFYAGDVVICTETDMYYGFKKGEVYTVTAFQGRVEDPNWATIKSNIEEWEWCINIPCISMFFKKVPNITYSRINHALP